MKTLLIKFSDSHSKNFSQTALHFLVNYTLSDQNMPLPLWCPLSLLSNSRQTKTICSTHLLAITPLALMVFMCPKSIKLF